MRAVLALVCCAILLSGACEREAASTGTTNMESAAPARPANSPSNAADGEASAAKPVDPAGIWFEEVGQETGIEFVHRSGHREQFLAPENTTGGACLFDYDNDDDLDAYFVQAADLNDPPGPVQGNELYRNRGDGTFERVAGAAGMGDTGYGMGCACGDYDADGDVDVYVTNYGPNVLYRNNGDGTFTDVTATAGVGDGAWGACAAFVDYDVDGLLDLFLVNNMIWTRETELVCRAPDGRLDYCSPQAYDAPAPDMLYRNAGGGVFENVTVSAGIDKAYGNGLGIVCADFNGDGLIDVYVANDANANQLWTNLGDGTFADRGLIGGCALNAYGTPEAGMGVVASDVDNDGDVDLFMSHLRGETNTFYLNEGGAFRDASIVTGLGPPSREFTGFGVGFADFDHDTLPDAYVVNGRVAYFEPILNRDDPYAEPNQLYRGLGNGKFVTHEPIDALAAPIVATSRGAAFGDIDNDGDVDIVIVDRDARAKVLRNVAGDRGHWVMFRVLDSRGLDAIGAEIIVKAGDREQRRLVQTAYSYFSSNDPRVHFGLGDAESVDSVTVRWLGGKMQEFGPVDVDSVHLLRMQGE